MTILKKTNLHVLKWIFKLCFKISCRLLGSSEPSTEIAKPISVKINSFAPITKAKQKVQREWKSIKKGKIYKVKPSYSITLDKYAPNIPIFLAEILQRRELKDKQRKKLNVSLPEMRRNGNWYASFVVLLLLSVKAGLCMFQSRDHTCLITDSRYPGLKLVVKNSIFSQVVPRENCFWQAHLTVSLSVIKKSLFSEIISFLRFSYLTIFKLTVYTKYLWFLRNPLNFTWPVV